MTNSNWSRTYCMPLFIYIRMWYYRRNVCIGLFFGHAGHHVSQRSLLPEINVPFLPLLPHDSWSNVCHTVHVAAKNYALHAWTHQH